MRSIRTYAAPERYFRFVLPLQRVTTSQSSKTCTWQARRVCGLRLRLKVPTLFIAFSRTVRGLTALVGETRTRSVQQRPLPWQLAYLERPAHMQYSGTSFSSAA